MVSNRNERRWVAGVLVAIVAIVLVLIERAPRTSMVTLPRGDSLEFLGLFREHEVTQTGTIRPRVVARYYARCEDSKCLRATADDLLSVAVFYAVQPRDSVVVVEHLFDVGPRWIGFRRSRYSSYRRTGLSSWEYAGETP